MERINIHQLVVTPGVMLRALTVAGLKWVMPTAQQLSLMHWSLNTLNSVIVVNKEKLPQPPLVSTLLGVPVALDDTLPNDVIELRRGDEVLVRIEGLAIPAGFE